MPSASVHYYEDSAEAAYRFLEEVLPLAQQSEPLRVVGQPIENGLEGKIAVRLIQL